MNKVEGFICRSCKTRTYPRHRRCPTCGGEDFESFDLGGRVRLLTFTRIYMLSLAFHERFITLGIGEFEDGLRALGKLLVDEPKVGMELEVVTGVVKMENGIPIQGLCFKEAAGA